jgi:hypothetical protein
MFADTAVRKFAAGTPLHRQKGDMSRLSGVSGPKASPGYIVYVVISPVPKGERHEQPTKQPQPL